MKNQFTARLLSMVVLSGPVLLLFLFLGSTGMVEARPLPIGQDSTSLVSDSGATVAPDPEKKFQGSAYRCIKARPEPRPKRFATLWSSNIPN